MGKVRSRISHDGPAKQPAGSVPKRSAVSVFFWTFFYLACSSTMLLINKLTVVYLTMPMFLLALQTLASVIILLVGRAFGTYSFPGFDLSKAMSWVFVMFAWAAPMVVNMKALQYTTVETVVVFRILSTFGVAIGDYFLFEERFSPASLVAMTVTVAGGVVYGGYDASFSFVGYVWGSLYFVATVFNGLFIKFVFNKMSVAMTNTEKTYYNNLMAVPILFAMSLVGETHQWHELPASFAAMPLMGHFVILLSCVMGTAISVAGTNCRDLISATSFNIAGNVNKFITVALSVVLLASPITARAGLGLLVALTGGAVYAFVKRK